VQLDYSSLSREHRAAGEGRQRDKLGSQFQADIEERSALLAKLAPNLKAVEQYEAVKVSCCAMHGLEMHCPVVGSFWHGCDFVVSL